MKDALWYRWTWYTVKEMTVEGGIVCPNAPGPLPIVVPQKHTSWECAAAQQCKCREGRFTPPNICLTFFHIGNTTVKCNVTWVVSWFPHANMTPIFVTRAVWYENPVSLDQECENITMTCPTIFFFADQTYPVADSVVEMSYLIPCPTNGSGCVH